MNLMVTLLIGVAIGAMVELLLPGHHPSELALAMLLGVMGAILARFFGEMTGWFDPAEPASFVASIAGSIIILAIWGGIFRRGPRQRRH
jgi:uncharacterized membrane protein YeaQ/YmgE (transglycosylase-associated protein family)